MQRAGFNIRPTVSIVLLLMVGLAFFCQPGLAGGASIVNTNKDIYHDGELIHVHFSNSPGKAGDWICIVPADSPDTDAGDYQYIPKGLSQGSLIFNTPVPGKYEVRAYYNYGRNGLVVAGRYAFSVERSAEGEADIMERKLDPNIPLETSLPPGNGLVYIFREKLFPSSHLDVEMKANGESVVFMGDSSYVPFSVPAGDVNFATGVIRDIFNINPQNEPTRVGSETIKIKSGHVYYLRLKIIPVPVWLLFLTHMPCKEASYIVHSDQLTQLGKTR